MSSSENNSPVETITIENPTQKLLNINMTNVSKLTATNYLMWSLQVRALLDGYGLIGHLDGSLTIPSQTITADAEVSVNPAYTVWKRHDQLIYSALIGALSVAVQPIVSRATTAYEVWNTLSSTYAKSRRGHIKQLKTQLKNWKKENKTIDIYLQGHIARLDQLAILGKAVDHEDQIDLILDGLPEDYKTVVDQIEGRDAPPTITELYEKLLNHEAKLLAAPDTVSSPVPTTANMAQQRGNNNNYNNRQRYNNNNNYKNHNNFQSPARQDNRSPRPYLGRCQICAVQGHSAKRCPQLLTQHSNAQTQINPFKPWQPRANFAGASSYAPDNWLLDSGATHHLTSDLQNLSLHQPYHGNDDVQIADGTGLSISHTGSSFLPSNTRPLALHKVLCVPNIHKNLISVYRLCNSNQFSVEFFPASFQVKDLSTGDLLLQGRTKDELYEWPIPKPPPTAMFSSPSPKTTLTYWHSRLGHPSLSILNTVVSHYKLPVSSFNKTLSPCSHCLLNKSHKLPFSKSSLKSTRPLELLFSDVWTSLILSKDHFKYYLVIVDHYSRYTWMYPIKKKSDVKEVFIAFKCLVENRFQQKIGTFFTDNGGEFMVLKTYLAANGITHLTSPPHTPEHNGVSERKHRHIVETGLTMLSKASVPKELCPYAFAAAVYTINRLPTPVLDLKTPYEKLFGDAPTYDKLRIFGCACYPWLRPYTKHKLDNRSQQCVFLGYSTTQSAYYCLDVDAARLYTSRHVTFDEESFPFQNRTQSSVSATPPVDPPSTSAFPPYTVVPPPCSDPHQSQPPPSTTPTKNPQVLPSLPLSTSSSSSHNSEPTAPLQNGPQPTAQPQPTPQNGPQPTAQPNQPSTEAQPILPTSPPGQIQTPINPSPTTTLAPNTQLTLSLPTTQTQTQNNEVPHQPSSSPPPNHHRMQTRSKNNIIKPIKKLTLTASLLKSPACEPRTIQQALKDKRWCPAATTEFDAMMQNRTWDLVPPHPTQNLVSCRWIFTTKYLPNGEVDRRNGRLVARGFNQRYGIDYAETFSPVIKSTTIRMVLDIAVKKNWAVKQLDVNNAFLQGDLQEEVFMSQPPGFIDPDKPDYVCRLNKPIYGLKQAPRAWYQSLKQHLLHGGFTNSAADTSLFIRRTGTSNTYVLVYVDDILVTGNDNNVIARVLHSLADRFSIKDPTDLHYFLGIEATRTKKGLHLMQRRYILDLLAKNNMTEAKQVSTPLPSSPKLTLASGIPLQDPSQYRSVVGSLQYLGFTRPDITYAVNRLSQFMHKPTDEHWQGAKRVLRYLAGTPSHGLFLQRHSPMTLHGFSDADWAGDTHDYVSTNAYVVYLGSNPISWSSKKQNGGARSSTGAEYRAVANITSEMNWITSLLTELGYKPPAVPVVYCDNIGATYLCANPVFHSRMKHIALDYHFVRTQIQAGVLRVSHVTTRDQLADALTKPLPRQHFQLTRIKLGVTQVPPA